MKFSIWLLQVILIYILGGLHCSAAGSFGQEQTQTYDLVIYGGTSAGVIAAVQGAKLGLDIALIEPGKHLGGLTSGGLGQTDIGNKNVIGGMAREFYHRIYQHYLKKEAWIFQDRESYREGSHDWEEEQTWWKFEPHVAQSVFKEMIDEAGVTVFFNERLDLKVGVEKHGTQIYFIRTESGKTFSGKIFLDTSYEGDLMAQAGVSHTVGREANTVYDETLNGVQTDNAIYHQIFEFVCPYIIPGKTQSGLLPGIGSSGPGMEGQGDRRVQAYCFRMCLTDVPDNQVPFSRPTDYDSLEYELLLRNFEAGEKNVPWINSEMPNRKTDTNNNRGVSTDYIGQNYDWPAGDYAARGRIFELHLRYQKGLMWTLANNPRVPQVIRTEVNRWGLAKDEFVETNHWPHQIYVREARRMISGYVMTENNCRGKVTAPLPIGMAAYTMDSHNVQRYVDTDGYVKNEGDVQVGKFPPYPVSYLSIIPKAEECTNLMVPVCLSASHIAFGSIRMEPVFMVLGQSAALAAAIALENEQAVQNINYASLREQLQIAGQILELNIEEN